MRLRRLLLGLLLVAVPVLVLLAAGVVTAGRLFAPPGLVWVRVVSLAPYATVGYLLALVLLLVARGRRTGRLRTATGLLAVLALVGLVLHAAWVAAPYVEARAAPRTGSPVTVLTVNLRIGAADTGQVVRLAVRERVDVLVLEEVTPAARAGLHRAGVDRLFAHRAGNTDPGSRGTLVFSRAPLSHVRRLGQGVTGCFAMDVALRAGRVHLVAAHPRAPIVSYADWRSDQRLLLRSAAALHGPTLVVGDLNATLDHPELRALLRAGYVDAASQAGVRWQPTWPSEGLVPVLGVPLPPLFAIDHVLLRGGPRAVGSRTVGVTGTDHRGLLVRISA
jgi:endonuclease/exonuclease/phosphatase (EEP) superfamily protein YafD